MKSAETVRPPNEVEIQAWHRFVRSAMETMGLFTLALVILTGRFLHW